MYICTHVHLGTCMNLDWLFLFHTTVWVADEYYVVWAPLLCDLDVSRVRQGDKAAHARW